MGIKLGDAIVYLRGDREPLKDSLKKGEQDTKSWASRVADGIGMALGNVLVNTVGRGIQAVANLGREVVNFSDQSRRAVGIFKAQLGATTDEALLLRDVAKEVFRQNFGTDLLDAANTVGLVRQQLRQLTTEQLSQVSQFALGLRDTYQTEVPKSIDAVNTLMSTLGLTHKQAMDFIAAGYQRGLDRSGDFLQSITEYGPQFQSMGANAGQFFSLMETGLQGGILGTDKISDLFKEFNNRILDGSSTTSEGLAKIGLSVQDITDQVNSGETTLADTFQLVIDRLATIDDEATRRQAGVALLGTQFEDLGMGTAVAFDLAKTKIDELLGASDALGARYENLGDMAQGLGRRFIVALEPAVGVFMDLANDAMPSVEVMFTRLEAVATQFAVGFSAVVKGIASVISGFFGGLRKDSDKSLGGVAQSAGGWGKAIVLQLAKGMAAAATAVIRVLQKLGSIISYWLKPNSPPKILPNIDKWGKAAAEVWLGGFTTANTGLLKKLGQGVQETLKGFTSVGDVKLFDVITSKIGQLFRSLPGAGENTSIINRIMGSRTAVAQAIRELRETGQVGQATYDLLARAMSPLPQMAQDYVRSLLDMSQAEKAVADAQERLNNLTQEYSDKLNPLQKELDAIRDKRQVTANEERIAELRKELATGSLSAEEEELALMEIREKEIQNQITAIENERDTAIEAAEDELDAAEEKKNAIQEQLDFQAQLLKSQEDNNKLVEEQMSLLDSLASALGGVASGLADAVGGGGIGAALGDMIGDIPVPDDLGDGLEDVISDALGDMNIEKLMGEIENTFAPIRKEAHKLGKDLSPILDYFSDLNQRFKEARSGGVLVNILKAIGIVFTTFKLTPLVVGFVTALTSLTSAGVLSTIATGIAAIGGPVTLLIGALVALGTAFATDFMGIRTQVEELWAIIKPLLDAYLGWVSELWQALKEGDFQGFITTLVEGWKSAGRFILATLSELWQSVKNWFGETDWRSLGLTLIERIGDGLASFWETISATVSGWYTAFVTWFQETDWLSLGLTIITKIGTALLTFWVTVIETINGWYASFWAWFNEVDWYGLGFLVVSTILDALITFWETVSTTVQGWYTSFTTWFKETDWKALGQTTLTELKEKFATFWEQAKETFDGWYTSISSWFSEQDWTSLASNIIEGIVSGIQAGVGSVMDAVSGLVDGAKDAWDEAWDSNSPSKLMKRSMKDDVVGGAVIGAEEGQDALNDAMRGVANDAFDNFSGQGQTAVPSTNPPAPVIQHITFMGDLNFKDKEVVDYFMSYLQSLTEQGSLQPFTEGVS